MAREQNAVSITGKISDGLSRFESYNNKEIYRFDQLGFTITGRLISGLSGFLIIVVMLMFTFSSAANQYDVADLGGIKSFTADVVITEQPGPSLSGVLDEGEFIEFGYLMVEIDWDYTSNLRITDIRVAVDWDASGGAGPGRQVTFDVSSDNNATGESQNDDGGGGEIVIEWSINPLISYQTERVSDTADSPEDFVSSFEKNGEWMGGKFTFTQASQGSIVLSESVDYTISLTYYTWELENVRELSEI